MRQPLAFLGAALVALLSACASGTDGDATDGSTTSSSGAGGDGGGASTTGVGGGEPGSGGAGGSDIGLGTHCATPTVEFTAMGPQSFAVKTEHYALTAETELARLLESSWGGFVEYFGVEPELAAGERLDVRFFASKANWAAAIAADGGAVPENAGGLFLPSTRRAYLYTQSNPYFDQVLLVHEAAHQLHLLGRAKGRALPFWYVEGIAEQLGRHDWDGKCARLGTVPLMNWDDLPKTALEDARDGGIDVAQLVAGDGTPTRAASWALVRYLGVGAAPPTRAAFEELRLAMDTGSTEASKTFEDLLGPASSLATPLGEWLPTSQQPMRPIFTEWVHRGPTSVLAYSPGVFSLAVVKASATHIESTFDVPATGPFRVGVVIGFDDPQTFKAIVVDRDGALYSFVAQSGQAFWYAAGKVAPFDSATTGKLVVDLDGSMQATLTVNGIATMHDTEFTSKVGVALNDARHRLRDLAWNGAPSDFGAQITSRT